MNNLLKRGQWRELPVVWLLISFVFFGVQLLLPVERGLTIVRLLGAPIYLPIIVNLICTVPILLFCRSQLAVSRVSKRWLVLNLVFAIFFFLTSAISTNWDVSLFYAYMWVSNFVLCFLIVDLFFDKIGLRGLVLVLCIVVVCQLVIGGMEGFFQTRFPIYEVASLDYLTSMGAVVLGERGTSWDLRIMGTLGDPILFSTALMLSVPFLAKVNHRLLRLVLICAACVVALMTLSRTVFVFLGCYSAFYLWNCSSWKKIATALVIVAVLLVGVLVWTPLFDNWSLRLDEEKDLQDLGGVEMRENMTMQAVEDTLFQSSLWQTLFGHGFYSTKEIASTYMDVSTTIDNSYATVLYEHGLTGLILYLVICLLPLRKIPDHTNYLMVAAYVGILLCGFSFATFGVFSINLLVMTIIVAVHKGNVPVRQGQVATLRHAFST